MEKEKYYSEYGLALVIKDEEICPFIDGVNLRLEELKKDGYLNDQDTEIEDITEFFEKMPDISHRARYFDDSSSVGLIFNPIEGICEEIQNAIVVYAKRQPEAFRRSYESISDLELEFASSLMKYFPKNFDFSKHIGYFGCAVKA